MEATMTAIEVTGIIDEHNRLQLDNLLPVRGPKRVRVIVLYLPDDEFDEDEWLTSVTHSPAFDFLADPSEEIYNVTDGKPFRHEV